MRCSIPAHRPRSPAWLSGFTRLPNASFKFRSDGRATAGDSKPVLIAGLALFAIGSVGCALAEDIYGLILARALQGTGAVGSVAFAALADLTRPNVRTQAYTITGIAIGTSFMIGLLGRAFSGGADRSWPDCFTCSRPSRFSPWFLPPLRFRWNGGPDKRSADGAHADADASAISGRSLSPRSCFPSRSICFFSPIR